ncbi:Patatin-like phospholipase domain-containing protein 2 [Varanus komodoensis]|nr:Patatin-like phospholipase domain-containing protein 2 [Varanus komodoensis]
MASSQCRPAELFRVVQGLVRPGPKDLIPPSKARCDDFARHFREKIAQIPHKLDSTIESEVLRETPMLPSGPELLDEFQLLRPDDVDKVLGRDSKHGIGTWILEVVNASLKEGRVPAPLKEAVVRPVLKKASLDPEMATNYRPVANIPFLGKVLERVVAGQLQALLDETDYLDPFQSGFRPGYGTESALVALYDDLCREKDRGSASLLVFLDLSAAFDTIDHGILLDRLAGLGVGTALQWFHSYLNGQFQKVVLGDYGSAPWQLCHGVPQGSILSPLLFNIYMKPLGEVIRRCGLRSHQYADDPQLYLSFSTNPGEAVAVLSRCLAEVMGWMRANKLKLNPDKTEVLLVGSSGLGEGELNLVLNGVALPPRDKVGSLGVLLDPELSLEAQVTAAYDCLATVTHALVTSRLDFCNTLYVGLPLKTVRILQLVQNRAARLLTGTGRYVHMTPVLRQLHWLPIEVRAQFKVLVMTYKALNGLGPGYLKEHLHPYMPSRPLRSAGEALLREPSVKEIRRERAPHLIRGARQIYGASAGALTGAVLLGGGSLVEACADVMGLAKEARKRNLGPLHPSFNVMKIIRDGLYKHLPENTHELIAGKLCISLTRVSDGKNRYVDGGISDNLPQYDSKDTITISPFSGECDICPKGNSANFHEFNLKNTSIQFSLGNLYRLTQALFPPEPKEHHQKCAQTPDYTDKKTNQDKKEINDEEMLIDQMTLPAWPLDRTIFEKLPPRLHKALQEACKEKLGLYAQLSKFLPMRLMSYMMLPYTLPVESAYFVALRLVDWFPDIPDDMRWMQEQLCQIMGAVYSKARKRLLSFPSKESGTWIRKCQTAPVNTSLHSSCCLPKKHHSSTHLEEWLWELPYCEDLAKKKVAVGINEGFDAIPPFFMNSEESGVEVDFDSSSEKSFQTAYED